MRSVALAIVLVLVCVEVAAAQLTAAKDVKETTTPFFEDLTVLKVLPEVNVNAILRDRYGFMWFGNFSELIRYDGYQTVRYSHEPDDPNSLSAGRIRTLLEDRNGDLWIGTLGGLSRYDRAADSFSRFVSDPGDVSSLPDNQVEALLEDKHGRIWVGTRGGLAWLDRSTDSFTRVARHTDDQNGISLDNTTALHDDPQGTLWIGTFGGGLSRYDPERGAFTHFTRDSEYPRRLSGDTVSAISEAPDGAIWIGTSGGLDRYDPTTETLSAVDRLAGFFVREVLADRRGVVWISAWVLNELGDLYKYDPVRRVLSRYSTDAKAGTGYDPGFQPFGIYEDPIGMVWIGTYRGGTNLLGRASRKFTAHAYTPDEPETVSFRFAQAIIESTLEPGVVWIGSEVAGLTRMNRETGSRTRYRLNSTAPDKLTSNWVQSLLEDRDGVLWIGTRGGGLTKLDPRSGAQQTYHHSAGDSTSLSSNWIISIHESRNGTLWFGPRYGVLNRLDKATGSFTRYSNAPNDYHLFDIQEAKDGTLWLASKGLMHFDPASGAFTAFTTGREPVDEVRTIFQDDGGRIWAGVGQGGLHLLDRDQGLLVPVFTEAHGLPHNHVRGIKGDGNGNLWIATDGGLTRYNCDTGEFRNYDVSDGLPDNRSRTLWRSPRGEMFLGTESGFVTFYPDQVRDNPHVPTVVLTDFRLFGESVRPGEGSPLTSVITVTEEITLRHNQNDFSFEFAALDYRNTDKNQYRYRLIPYETAWRNVGTVREASYMNLRSGTYTFTVHGSNDDGVWNVEGRSLRIIILPPWWRTWWAWMSYAIGLTVVVVTGYEMRVRNLRKRAAELHSVVQERTQELVDEKEKTEEQARRLAELDEAKNRFFANISHEFRTPLTLIIGPLRDALEGALDDKPDERNRQWSVMLENARRLLRLVNQLLDLSKLQSGKMRLAPAAGDLAMFVRNNVRRFVPLAETKQISLRVSSDEETIWCTFDPDVVEKIVDNLISNALKFGRPGDRVSVNIRTVETSEEKKVEIDVEDTGPGLGQEDLGRIFERFEQSASTGRRHVDGTGIGLSLAKELADLHDGEILATSEVGVGSTFTLRLPLNEAKSDRAEVTLTDPGVKTVGSLAAASARHPQSEDGSVTTEQARSLDTVLIVEDNRDVRAYLRGHLESEYRIVEAENGEEGLDRAHEHSPDLILSDVMMPAMDGYEMCRLLKASEKLRHIPVIMLTARVGEAATVEGIRSGADAYVEKPFSISELMVRVSGLIKARRALRELFSREIIVKPADIAITSEDEAFLQQVQDVIDVHLADTTFNVDWLAEEVGMSRRQLERRTKNVVGQPPGSLIRRLRLERGSQLLLARAGSVSEVAYAVGFGSPTQFARAFRKVYGVSPAEHARSPSPADSD